MQHSHHTLSEQAARLSASIRDNLRSHDDAAASDACAAAHELNMRLRDSFELAAVTRITRIVLAAFGQLPTLQEIEIFCSAESGRASISVWLGHHDERELDESEHLLGSIDAADVARYFGESFAGGLRISRADVDAAVDPLALARLLYRRTGRSLPGV